MSQIILDGDPMDRLSLIRTNMATQNFSTQERLLFAITDDDIPTFDKLGIPLCDLVKLRFEGGTNILNFAIEQERPNIVSHLAHLTAGRQDLRLELLEHRFRVDQLAAIHQVMNIGNRTMINILLRDFEASLDLVTQNKLSILHLAAQQYNGYMSLLVLIKENHYFNVNVRDNFKATPLHFAILKNEFMNVQLLIKFGADVNAQDQMGLAPLHICVMRIGQSPDDFEDFKKIIKELLFNGANRSLTNEQGQSPRDMLEEIIEELDHADYVQLKSILTYKRPCLCFMRRRPI